jgi:molybdate transport system regulatory protein
VPNADMDTLALKTGQTVFAQFDDDKVIIATLC